MSADAISRKAAGEAIANELSEELDSDIFILNAPIEPGLDTKITHSVLNRKRRSNIVIFLVTEGGSADTAYRIARCFQNFYKKVTTIVAGWCKSAGTLICVGANELVIGEFGELGPLDVQLAKPDELGLISSGLTIDSSFRSLQAAAFQMFERSLLDIYAKSGGRITTKTAAELAVNLSVGLFSPIYEQMDPAKIGEDYRSTRIAEEYALRLGVFSQNLSTNHEIDPIEMLVRGYPSHGFVIDRKEAENLFDRVLRLEGKFLALATLLSGVVVRPRTPGLMCYLGSEKENEKSAKSDKAPNITADEGGEGKGEQQLQKDFVEGDGVVPIPISKRSPRANGKNQNSK